ncbi:MAG: gliding motility-associated C-terminal domain-containing protein [Chitinophagales bacterium]|nr:gliding motility-associated C-terminal domain-containing protein [Chitinophagales bacterium]
MQRAKVVIEVLDEVDGLSPVTSDVCALKIANGFSPNGDGLNDNFVLPHTTCYQYKNIVIFDRYSRIVYQAENINETF